MKLPATRAIYHQKDDRVSMIFPLAPVQLHKMVKSRLSIPQALGVFEKIKEACVDQDALQGLRMGIFYGSVELSKEDWEWILLEKIKAEKGLTP